jgi:hypothetical protein
MAAKKDNARSKSQAASSAAKVRMADTKATKAAAAKAPRYPRGQQSWGMETSKGGAYVSRGRSGDDYPGGNYDNPQGGRQGTFVVVDAKNKNAKSLLKTAMNSKAANVKSGTKNKLVDKNTQKSYDGKNTYMYREYAAKQPKVTVKKVTVKKSSRSMMGK